MRVFGLDFTSAPSPRKPLVLISCVLCPGALEATAWEEIPGFEGFEAFLNSPGPWVCGMDFPFGQPRRLVAALGWPPGWEGYVRAVSRLTKEEFEAALRAACVGDAAARRCLLQGLRRLLWRRVVG